MKPRIAEILTLVITLAVTQGAQAAPLDDILAALRQDAGYVIPEEIFERASHRVAQVTGLRVTNKITVKSLEAGAIKIAYSRAADERFDRFTGPDALAGHEYLLKRLALVKPDFDLSQYYSRIDMRMPLGFYDEKTKEMVILKGARGQMVEIVMLHEATHAAQDSHISLGEAIKQRTGSYDAQMALFSMVEGQAELCVILSSQVGRGEAKGLKDIANEINQWTRKKGVDKFSAVTQVQ